MPRILIVRDILLIDKCETVDMVARANQNEANTNGGIRYSYGITLHTFETKILFYGS